MDNIREPDFTKGIDVLAFLHNEFHVCGCFELEFIVKLLEEFLEWSSWDIGIRERYDKFFAGNVGVFYLLAGILNDLDLIGHGSSIRGCWTERRGGLFLEGLRKFGATLDDISGIGYDGCCYGG